MFGGWKKETLDKDDEYAVNIHMGMWKSQAETEQTTKPAFYQSHCNVVSSNPV